MTTLLFSSAYPIGDGYLKGAIDNYLLFGTAKLIINS